MSILMRYFIAGCTLVLVTAQKGGSDSSAPIAAIRDCIVRVYAYTRGPLTERSSLNITCGVLLDSSGLIVMPGFDFTSKKDSLEVIFSDGKRMTGKKLGTDDAFMLAYASIGPVSVTPAKIAAERPTIGSPVLAAGYADMDLHKSGYFAVSQGIISSDLANIWPEHAAGYFLVTDLSAADGQNLLFNLNGELLSVAPIYGGPLKMPGTCYYPLMDVPLRIREELQSGQVPSHGKLGIAVDTDAPVIVRHVTSESLRLAGLREGDQIVSWEGILLRGAPDLVRLARGARPGTTVDLMIRRGATELLQIRAEVAEHPTTCPLAPIPESPRLPGRQAR